LEVVKIIVPGAPKSMLLPVFEKVATVFMFVVALTVRTYGLSGDESTIPSLPADIVTTPPLLWKY
jgi:hypothetical protein